MRYASRIVLVVPLRAPERLEAFVAQCLRDEVELIAVVGEGCEPVHDLIDEILVGDGTGERRFITTTWHRDESVADALAFAEIFRAKKETAVQLVEI